MANRVPEDVRIEKHQTFNHTRVVANFELGFGHKLIYERSDRGFGGDVSITLDGEDLVRDSLSKLALGSHTYSFLVENEPGEIRIHGVGILMWVKVSVNGIDVLKV
jgi:hypothetical protein